MASRKIQLPAIGGLRKVIKTGSEASTATTIAEFANQIITLSQLKAALGLTNQSGGGSGGGSGVNAALIPGPGLSGGGPIIGAVPINLIAPIPAFVFEEGGGGDADPGPPGQRGIDGVPGATGQQGPIGPAVQMIPDDGEDGWHAIPGDRGPAGGTGQQGPLGPAVFLSADDGEDGWHAIPGTPGANGNPGAPGAAGQPGPAVGIMDTGEGTDEMPFVAPSIPFRIVNKGAFWGQEPAIVAADHPVFYVTCPVEGTIVRVRVVTEGGPGNCVLDIWKAPFTSYPPTVANTITAAAKPTISAGTTYVDSTLTGWTRRINAGDVLGFKIDSTATFTLIQVVIEVQQ